EAEHNRPRAIEQIWMPGVHADIGGNADGVFLSDVALLTMIERVKHYCKTTVWDDVVIDDCKNQLGRKMAVAISNERPDWKRKFFFKASRQVGGSPKSDQHPTVVGEKLHPVFDCLDGKHFWIRSKWQKYESKNVPRDMERFTSKD